MHFIFVLFSECTFIFSSYSKDLGKRSRSELVAAEEDIYSDLPVMSERTQ